MSHLLELHSCVNVVNAARISSICGPRNWGDVRSAYRSWRNFPTSSVTDNSSSWVWANWLPSRRLYMLEAASTYKKINIWWLRSEIEYIPGRDEDEQQHAKMAHGNPVCQVRLRFPLRYTLALAKQDGQRRSRQGNQPTLRMPFHLGY